MLQAGGVGFGASDGFVIGVSVLRVFGEIILDERLFLCELEPGEGRGWSSRCRGESAHPGAGDEHGRERSLRGWSTGQR